ncbi:tetracycline regulation of excision, RteC [Sinomicrobium pectinilyticum]|uniref:Tetracycline regulation of excision, RteC n=1 Tax=Sinomicrobium pectinilyticum TaxID=1084421 RepID=A0A3N0EQG2_SINP1|nr:RteC domain-containing protein [Sinomicrobium pectinilyticum]RNL90110.1 tetracycline regulation of excision, RteC [Sinomicrobium pectinilyticum]
MKIYKEILQRLDDDLDTLETETKDILEKTEKGIKLSRKALRNMRDQVITNGFESSRNEIIFFKKIKPRLCSKLIYCAKLFNIESKRPRGSNKSQIKYLNNHIHKLQDYFNDNLEFFHYYRRNATAFDEHYFLREKMDIRLRMETYYCLTDEQFSTCHDSTVATIMAYDMLIVYLKKEIEKIENNNPTDSFFQSNIKPTRLFWTANKTDLVELIYALHSCRAINSGTADIKEMAAISEQIFNIELGDYYHTFLEIRSRKINPTKFIDNLKDSLLQKMQDLDE